MKISNHIQLLNALIEKYDLKSYLEIGVQNPANNFDRIKCEYKWGVEPEEMYRPNISTCDSDRYFKLFSDKIYDCIFIDGLHHADQVKRDFENSLRCLSDKGFIVIHDVLPDNEEGTIVPRQTKIWWGDVYKFAMTLPEYKEVSWKTLNIDNGCMIIWKTDPGKVFLMSWTEYPIIWDSYLKDGKRVMNVTDEIEI